MATYYVAPNGNNANNGSSGSPWLSASYAVSSSRNLQPGDTVIFRPGTYNTSTTLNLGANGSAAGGYITWKSEVRGGARIVSTAAQGFNTNSKRYVRIEGFDVTAVNGGITSNYGHHIEIVGNIVHGTGKNGIYCGLNEWLLIEGNEVYECTMDGTANNALTIHNMQPSSGDTSTPGYRCIVRNNIFHDNGTTQTSTDSGGIMMDQDYNNPAVSNTTYQPYNYPRLVENNLCYRNGGPGIIVLGDSRATSGSVASVYYDVLVRCNTVWDNGRKPNAGDMVAGIVCRASGAKFINNIAVADRSRNSLVRAISVVSLPSFPLVFRDLVFRNNLTFNGVPGETSVYSNNGGNNNANLPRAADGNLLGVNPLFVSTAARDFRLQAGSPAIDAGTTTNNGMPATDIVGAPRTGIPDIGAYEAVSVVTATMAPNSLVAAGVYVREATTGEDIESRAALGGNFVTRSSRDEPGPASWIGDTGNSTQNTFPAVTKTMGTTTQGALVFAFSMKPSA